MGKTYTVQLDDASTRKIFSKRPNCKECGAKVKIHKETIYQGRGNHEMKGYTGENKMPVKILFKRKQIYLNQDIYEVKFKFKCPDCGKIYELNEI